MFRAGDRRVHRRVQRGNRRVIRGFRTHSWNEGVVVATQNFGRDQNVELMRRVHAGEAFDVGLMPRCDVQLRGTGFADNSADLELQLSSQISGVELRWMLIARDVHSLKIDLDYGDRGNRMPMTWDMLIDQDCKQEWFAILDFASHGEVRFKCSALEIGSYTAEPAQADADAVATSTDSAATSVGLAESVQFVIVLDSDELENPDTDLALLLPQAIEARTDGYLVSERWAYDLEERMHLYFRCSERAAGFSAMKSALASGPVCGNALDGVLIGCREPGQGSFEVLSPSSATGGEIIEIAG